MSIKVGIFFGGPSREREISFAGGRTVYDNLDKALFEAVPIFVDSGGRWILLDWQYLYRGTVRDFFPPIELAPKSAHGFQVYQESLGPLSELETEAMAGKVGRRIRREELGELIDVAFLALHGEYGEDGRIQRELEYAGIPYTGSGVEASEIGMDKALQKELMQARGFPSPNIRVIEKGNFDGERVNEHFTASVADIGWPMVIRPARQGSSIGVAILKEHEGKEAFTRAVNAAFFREVLPLAEYAARLEYERLEYVRQISDLRDGLAFPLDAKNGDHELTLYTPDELHDYLEKAVVSDVQHQTSDAKHQTPDILLTAHQSEEKVIVESFIDGKEFSCIVVRTEQGDSVALPPTEIVKAGSELFDYRSKYMPGRSRKVTPIELATDRIQAIRGECERLFEELGFHVYARIDGFHTASGDIFLNDPNTTSGMMPSSFFFHQAAEIGLNPSQFLTFIIRQSLRERGMQSSLTETATALGGQLDADLLAQRAAATEKERIGVLLGGPGFERHISVESGRNIYEKLASSEGYRPVPFFLSPGEGSEDKPYQLHQLPINLLLKDNADDIRDKLAKTGEHPVVAEIRQACIAITERYADPAVVFHPQAREWAELPGLIDGVFIALHGRPGEDGQVQSLLEPLGLYYNGSGIASSQITIDKHATLRALGAAGLPVTKQWLASADDFFDNNEAFYTRVENQFAYPLIAKPVDDGCSSAVKLLKDREELAAYCCLTFQPEGTDVPACRRHMKLVDKDEWPVGKQTILFEAAITADENTAKFLEITGGMLTHLGVDGQVRYEVFEPSEALAGGEVLSLEEKFLAGEGQNLTPARLGTDDYSYDFVAGQVKADLERAARAVSVEGYCRIDAFVRILTDGEVQTIPIEVNSLPGMTPATAIFHQAALAGYQPADFIGQILQYGKAKRDAAAVTPSAAYLAANTPTAMRDEDEDDNKSQLTEEKLETPTKTELRPVHVPFSDPFFDDPAPTAAEEPEDLEPEATDDPFDSPFFQDNSVVEPEPVTVDHLVSPPPPEMPDWDAAATSTFGQEDPVAAEAPITDNKIRLSFKKRLLGFGGSSWRMFKSSYFWKSIAGALLFFVLCFFLLNTALSWYTAHGKSTQLPDFVGMMRADAEDVADDLGLTLKFEKGAFDPNRPAGEVVLQHPKAGAGVKKNRSIYLTILSDEAPMIKLPSLVGNYDYTNYANRIEAIGDIRSKIREQVYDPKQEENTILHLFDGDRKVTDADLRGGYEVPQGSTLEFVVTVRQTGEVRVPNLKCKRFGVVEFLLDGSDLLVGTIHGNVGDRSEAFVIRTEPAAGKMVPVGSKFDIYLSGRRPDGCE